MAIIKRKNSKFWYIVIRKNGKQLWIRPIQKTRTRPRNSD